MSKANETNQTKPEFKIETCDDCPADGMCIYLTSPIPLKEQVIKTCEAKKKIERLVNGKR